MYNANRGQNLDWGDEIYICDCAEGDIRFQLSIPTCTHSSALRPCWTKKRCIAHCVYGRRIILPSTLVARKLQNFDIKVSSKTIILRE